MENIHQRGKIIEQIRPLGPLIVECFIRRNIWHIRSERNEIYTFPRSGTKHGGKTERKIRLTLFNVNLKVRSRLLKIHARGGINWIEISTWTLVQSSKAVLILTGESVRFIRRNFSGREVPVIENIRGE